MTPRWLGPRFAVLRSAACVQCGVCAEQCAHGVHQTNPKTGALTADAARCVNCQRCVACCPVGALQIAPAANRFGSGPVWGQSALEEVYRQAQTGGVLLSAMGSPRALPVYWDSLVLNASQVTNPSIDPLREPMETAVYLGKRPAAVRRTAAGALDTTLPPHLLAKTPILFSAMSYGAVSYGVHKALALAAQRLGTYYNTGEGGLHESLYEYGQNTIVQVASGRFGVHRAYLEAGAAIEIKIGQGAKPGIGGHLPGAKIQGSVAETRMVPPGVDAISPAPHHDIYSIEDLSQLVYSLKEATGGRKPVMVKVAAVHNIAAIASGIARSGADIIEIDGFCGGTGAAPARIRDNVGIPIELALAAVDTRLREECIRDEVSVVVSGSIRSSADAAKAIALGADAVSIGTAALCALGCHMCRACHTGLCSWGIATQAPHLAARLDAEAGAQRPVNLVTAWTNELKELMGGMGINSIEALRGNRLALRGVGLNERELGVLGVKHAGEN